MDRDRAQASALAVSLNMWMLPLVVCITARRRAADERTRASLGGLEKNAGASARPGLVLVGSLEASLEQPLCQSAVGECRASMKSPWLWALTDLRRMPGRRSGLLSAGSWRCCWRFAASQSKSSGELPPDPLKFS